MTDLISDLTAAVREADETHERTGGGSRHWVRECLVPALEERGLKVGPVPLDVDTANYIAALELHITMLENLNRGGSKPGPAAFKRAKQACPDWWPRLGDEVEARTGTVGGVVYKREGLMVSFRDEINTYTMPLADVKVIKRAT